jgi:hypothetical protein
MMGRYLEQLKSLQDNYRSISVDEMVSEMEARIDALLAQIVGDGIRREDVQRENKHLKEYIAELKAAILEFFKAWDFLEEKQNQRGLLESNDPAVKSTAIAQFRVANDLLNSAARNLRTRLEAEKAGG